ncbi:hypothetical protein NDU88_001499 [Pleurodeles waltl]|uniref:Uncharacterized protein n=1 Tax=Pleurodeles waltl TaxID=8319 RepID=A0AAV7WLX5_PLEWA|nr:hypothetical protein NDU88_001497 [Pleurodeles waltl]KAJ1213869.1 hypothetical protein NDU88_001499 [Pleurodeles waltl]
MSNNQTAASCVVNWRVKERAGQAPPYFIPSTLDTVRHHGAGMGLGSSGVLVLQCAVEEISDAARRREHDRPLQCGAPRPPRSLNVPLGRKKPRTDRCLQASNEAAPPRQLTGTGAAPPRDQLLNVLLPRREGRSPWVAH